MHRMMFKGNIRISRKPRRWRGKIRNTWKRENNGKVSAKPEKSNRHTNTGPEMKNPTVSETKPYDERESFLNLWSFF